MRISDWSSDVCSSDLYAFFIKKGDPIFRSLLDGTLAGMMKDGEMAKMYDKWFLHPVPPKNANFNMPMRDLVKQAYANPRSEEHTSELQSLMRISYAVFCLQQQN